MQQNAKNLSAIKDPEVYKRTLDGMQLELYVVLSAHGYESLGAKQAANVKQIVTQMKDAIDKCRMDCYVPLISAATHAMIIDTGATERSIRCTSRMDKACLSK